MADIQCPVCETGFEADELEYCIPDEGNCPNCGNKFYFDFDCNDDIDAILIPYFEYWSKDEKNPYF